MNTLPDTLKKHIADEAEAFAKQWIKTLGDRAYTDYVSQGYTAAAIAILSNPGEWGLTGSWVRATDAKRIDDYQTVYARYNKDELISSGYFVSEDNCFVLHYHGIRIKSSDFEKLEIFQEPATTSSRVQQLEQALREAQKWCDETDYDDMPAEDILREIRKIVNDSLEP